MKRLALIALCFCLFGCLNKKSAEKAPVSQSELQPQNTSVNPLKCDSVIPLPAGWSAVENGNAREYIRQSPVGFLQVFSQWTSGTSSHDVFDEIDGILKGGGFVIVSQERFKDETANYYFVQAVIPKALLDEGSLSGKEVKVGIFFAHKADSLYSHGFNAVWENTPPDLDARSRVDIAQIVQKSSCEKLEKWAGAFNVAVNTLVVKTVSGHKSK